MGCGGEEDVGQLGTQADSQLCLDPRDTVQLDGVYAV